MRLLLDSHVLLWWLADDRAIRSVRDEIIAAPLVYVSAATVWELGIKARLGRLELPGSLVDVLGASRMDPLPITAVHAEAAAALPHHHRDPFDRMLVAQAQVERLTLVTHDRQLEAYAGHRLWI